MAEVVTVPVLGKVKQSWLYAGGAAVAGIVGYAWWSGAGQGEDEVLEVELPATDYEPPTVVDSGISVGGGLPQGEPIARTNVEWASMAREQGDALGFDVAVVNSALTKYLGKDRLTVTEAAAIAAIVAILGQPPTGGPYSILNAPVTPPPPHVGMSAPILTRSAPIYRNGAWEYTIAWAPVPGATRYWFEHVGGSTGYITTTKTSVIRAGASRTDTWRFAGVSADNVKGPVATIAVPLAAAPAGAPRPAPAPAARPRIPANPASMGLLPLGRGRYRIAFPAVSGATRYRYRWETSNRASAWAYGSPNRNIEVRWLFATRGTQFRARVQAGNSAGFSQGRLSNIVRSS
jgi:hypothetical protein